MVNSFADVIYINVRTRIIFCPIRTAVSGKQSTPGGAFEIMEIIGKEESLKRMETGIRKLEQANQE